MGDEAKVMPTMAKAFTKETGIKVKVQALPWSNAHDKLLTAVASKGGPDVVQLGTTWMPEFQKAGALEDMSAYTDKYNNLKSENFLPGAVRTTKYDGKFYGTPWVSETRVLFYRTDTLKSVGYDQAPQTWNELKDAAKKLSARGKDKYGITIDMKEQSLGFMFARQNGSKLITNDFKDPQFNKAPFTEAVSYLSEFIQKGYAPKADLGMDVSQTFTGDDPIVPMFISGPWMITAVKDTAKGIDGKWAVAELPKGSKNNISSLGGSDLTIWKYGKNKNNAAKFIDFMSTKKNQLKFMKLSNDLPALKSAWKDDSLAKDPYLSVVGKQIKTAMPMPETPKFEELAQSYLKHFESIAVGNADVKTEMNTFNDEAKTTLQSN